MIILNNTLIIFLFTILITICGCNTNSIAHNENRAYKKRYYDEYVDIFFSDGSTLKLQNYHYIRIKDQNTSDFMFHSDDGDIRTYPPEQISKVVVKYKYVTTTKQVFPIILCPDCNGTGYPELDFRPKRCEDCDGTGEYDEHIRKLKDII